MISPFNTILVVIDPTAEEQPARKRATSLAKQSRASLELFICDHDQYIAGERFFDARSLEEARERFMETRRKKLQKLAQKLRTEGLSVKIDVRWDHPLDDGILHKVLESKPDLVVKDTHFHTAIRRTIFSNTDWNLIRACPAPLLLVKSRPLSAVPQLVAAVDPLHEHAKPAELDDSILSTARKLGTALGGELHVFHAFNPAALLVVSDSMTAPISVPARDLIESLERQHRDAVGVLAQKYTISPERVLLQQGVTPDLLIKLAEQLPADIVVMGAVSRSALERVFLGSTAERALDRLPCDLLIVKAPGSESRQRE